MELRDLYIKIAPHIVSLTALRECKDGYSLAGNGTGFLTGDGYLITNFHVMEKILLGIHQGENYILRIGQSERKKITLPVTTEEIIHKDGTIEHKIEKMDFMFGVHDIKSSRIKEWLTCYSSDEHTNDYIILNPQITLSPTTPEQVTELNIAGQKLSVCLPSHNKQYKMLDLQQDNKVYVGQKVCIFGYPFEKENLCMNQGIISSMYGRCGVKVFQIDGIVNNGNSGGPLVDVETGRIIGIVSRKEDGLNKTFEQLKKAVESNIKLAQQSSQCGGIIIGGINHAEAIEKTFITINALISHIERSANVGIGYAFSVNKIIEDLKILRTENK